MRTLVAALLLSASSAWAGGPLIDNSETTKQVAVQVAKANQHQLAVAAPVMVLKNPMTMTSTSTTAKQNIPPVVASATAAPPSAQCRFGWGVQFGVQEFGIGGSGSEWDRICGLWLAAQQTSGEPSNEAATAAFCLTMKDAEIHSDRCEAWKVAQAEGRELAKEQNVALSDTEARVIFGGAGSGGWN